jgi:hypothetical protein
MEVSGEFNGLATLPRGIDSTLLTVWEGERASEINAAVEINVERVNEI